MQSSTGNDGFLARLILSLDALSWSRQRATDMLSCLVLFPRFFRRIADDLPTYLLSTLPYQRA